MLFMASLFKRSSLAFLFITAVRALSIVACLLGFAAELFILVTSIRGVERAERNNSSSSSQHSIGNEPGSSTVLATEDPKPTCGYIGSTGVPKEFGAILFFTLSQLFGILILSLCFLSEISFSFLLRFFDSYFPPLGSEFGVGFIGCLEVFTACNLLSRHLGLFASVAGWWLYVVGILNVMLGIMSGKKIRSRRSLVQAGKTYAKDVTHFDDIEKGVKTGKKTLELGKKVAGKVVNISAPMPPPPPPTYDPVTNPVPVFNGPRRVS